LTQPSDPQEPGPTWELLLLLLLLKVQLLLLQGLQG
jgi:hypothetical protein